MRSAGRSRKKRNPAGDGSPVLAGHPALDFVNTQWKQGGRLQEGLASVSALADWMMRAGLLSPAEAERAQRRWEGSAAGERVLREARRFRGLLRQAVARLAQGRRVDAAQLAAVNRWLRHPSGFHQVQQGAGGLEVRFQPNLRRPQQLLALVAEQAADLLCAARPGRIKRCGNPACVLYFYDATRSRTRHWCSMSTCGSRMKAAAYYRRKRAPGEKPTPA